MLIHVGYHKCASKFLQTHLFPNLGGRYHHLPRVALDHIGKAERFRAETFLAQVGVTPERTGLTILSHEELSGHVYGHAGIDAFRLAERLQGTFEDARVLLVVRNQLEYIRSVYAYRVCVQGMERRTYERFLAEEGERGLFHKLEYHHLVAHYCAVFGPQNVLVVPMELLGDGASRLFARVGAHAGAAPPRPGSAVPVNVSSKLSIAVGLSRRLNGPAAAVDRWLRRTSVASADRFARGYGLVQRHLLTPSINRVFARAEALRFPPGRRAELCERYGASNRALARLVDFDPADHGYPGSGT